jgi:hypothetical protein
MQETSGSFSNDSFLEAASFAPQWVKEPYSWVGHIPFTSWLVRIARPRIIVELGTHSGNSYFSICQAVRQYETGSNCYAVDTWQGDAHAFSYGEEIYEMVRRHNKENYASFSKLLRMTFDEALSKFENGSVDLLHIDGLHTYDAVKHDFETWLPKLAPGAIVLFHDTNVRKDDFGVWKYWGELKDRYAHCIEFMHSNGLGVLEFYGASNSESSNSEAKIEIIKQEHICFFTSLGKKYDCLWDLSALDQANLKHLEQVRELWSERDQLLAELSLLKSSLSWRATAPFRVVQAFFTYK